MANEIYDSTWWGNTIQTASSIGTSTEMIQGQFNLTKLGDEEVTNGGFDTDSDWTKQSNWTISNGQANSNGNGSIFQNASFITGRTYKAFFEITSISSGRVSYRTNTLQNYFSEIGTHTVTWVYDGSFNFIYLLGDSNFIGSVDNISVKEVRAEEVEAVKCLADAIHRIGIQDIQN